jgi:antitoxin component of MazEF toxin-antitoxin module
MTKLKSIGGSLAVIIPADIVRQAGLKKGQRVDVAYAEGKVLIAPAAKPDWASFFARDYGIPADWELERKQPERRDVFADWSEDGSERRARRRSSVKLR